MKKNLSFDIVRRQKRQSCGARIVFDRYFIENGIIFSTNNNILTVLDIYNDESDHILNLNSY